MLGKIVSFVFYLLLVLVVCVSCSKDSPMQPGQILFREDERIRATSVTAGELHNQILSEYAGGRNLLLETTPVNEDIIRFVNAVNTVMERNDLSLRIDERYVRDGIEMLKKVSMESGYNIFDHGDDPEKLIHYIDRKGLISSAYSRRLEGCIGEVEKFIAGGRKYLKLVGAANSCYDEDILIDIMEHSAEWWKLQITEANVRLFLGEEGDSTGINGGKEDDDEPDGWWNVHKAQVREASIVVADACGGAFGSIGGVAGVAVFASLASCSLSLLWPPY